MEIVKIIAISVFVFFCVEKGAIGESRERSKLPLGNAAGFGARDNVTDKPLNGVSPWNGRAGFEFFPNPKHRDPWMFQTLKQQIRSGTVQPNGGSRTMAFSPN